MYPHNIRFLDDLVQLDAQSLEKLKLHLLFLGGLQANAEFDDSDEEEEDGKLKLLKKELSDKDEQHTLVK